MCVLVVVMRVYDDSQKARNTKNELTHIHTAQNDAYKKLTPKRHEGARDAANILSGRSRNHSPWLMSQITQTYAYIEIRAVDIKWQRKNTDTAASTTYSQHKKKSSTTAASYDPIKRKKPS